MLPQRIGTDFIDPISTTLGFRIEATISNFFFQRKENVKEEIDAADADWNIFFSVLLNKTYPPDLKTIVKI